MTRFCRRYIVAEKLLVFDYAECQRQVVLAYAHTYARRETGNFEIDVVELNADSFIFEQCPHHKGTLVSVYCQSNQSRH